MSPACFTSWSADCSSLSSSPSSSTAAGLGSKHINDRYWSVPAVLVHRHTSSSSVSMHLKFQTGNRLNLSSFFVVEGSDDQFSSLQVRSTDPGRNRDRSSFFQHAGMSPKTLNRNKILLCSSIRSQTPAVVRPRSVQSSATRVLQTEVANPCWAAKRLLIIDERWTLTFRVDRMLSIFISTPQRIISDILNRKRSDKAKLKKPSLRTINA